MKQKMTSKLSFIQRFNKNRDRNAILICIVIAIAFWLTDALSHPYTHDYNFTLDYELQENVSFASAPRETIKARLSGQGWELLKASIKRKFKHVPVQVLRAEVTRSDLIAAVYQHLSDYEIVVREVDIDVMTLDINMVITRSIPIQFNTKVEAADGFRFINDSHLSPATVTVTGPSSLVERLGPFEIEEIEMIPLSANFNQTVNVLIPEMSYISVEPKQVQIVAEVEKIVQITTSLPLQFVGDTSGLDIIPLSVSVSYSLGESLANAAEQHNIRAEVSITQNEISIGKAAIRLLNMPDYTDNIKIRPDSASISARQED
jgi:hypothetical protein